MSVPSSHSSLPHAPASQASAPAISRRSPAAHARNHTKRSLAAFGCVALIVLPGCYFAHLARGQLELLRAAQPIDTVLADAQTEPPVRDALELVAPVLSYARALGLDVTDQYRTYAAWPGDRVVTTVVATRPREVEPAGFWFPLVGRLPYKGYFDAQRAEAEAARLRSRGLDTCVVPVAAYSTLGWFADPVTTPLLRGGAGRFVETLLHELVHATIFVADDTALSEGVATFIGQEGVIRFFADHAGPEAADAERRRIADQRAIARELGALRERVVALYDAAAETADVEASRAALSDESRAAIAALPLTSFDPAAVAAAARLNDACLALAATYQADLGALGQRLAMLGGELPAFVAEVRAAADTDDPRDALGLPPAPLGVDSNR
jgi:predicted aminopeptidase